MMEKAFALKETHFPTNSIAIYNTLDRRVIHIVFLSDPEWPNRDREEVLKCPECKHFILPDIKHICNSRGIGRREEHGSKSGGCPIAEGMGIAGRSEPDNIGSPV